MDRLVPDLAPGHLCARIALWRTWIPIEERAVSGKPSIRATRSCAWRVARARSGDVQSQK